jgi:hypothetical protein
VQDDRLSVNDKTWNSLADYCVTHGIAVEMARRLTIQTD